MAATNKTPNLNLPQWVQGDEIEREDFNAAFDAIDTTVASHLAESANKHIKESGSDDDGHYIKFDDGTMIYYGFFTYVGPCSGAVGALYRSNSGVPFPATPNDFVGDVIRRFNAVPSASGTDAVIFGIEFQANANRVDMFTPISHANITVKIGFEYIGRWK